MSWDVSDRTLAGLWGVASSILSKQKSESLCTPYMNFFFLRFINFKWCKLYNNTNTATAMKYNHFYLSKKLDSNIVDKIFFNAYTFPMRFVDITFSRSDIPADEYEMSY